MIRRRHDHRPLADRTNPHWLAVTDMHGKLVYSEPLPIGTDLYARLHRVLERWQADGWTVEARNPHHSSVFCNRNGERRLIHIRPTDPAVEALYGPSTYNGNPAA